MRHGFPFLYSSRLSNKHAHSSCFTNLVLSELLHDACFELHSFNSFWLSLRLILALAAASRFPRPSPSPLCQIALGSTLALPGRSHISLLKRMATKSIKPCFSLHQPCIFKCVLTLIPILLENQIIETSLLHQMLGPKPAA